jgi:tryptophan synthase alpha chain
MARLAAAFDGRPAFMPYYPLGYPTPAASLDVIEALARRGADLIEVGVPFSDPLADGPVIQHATQVALQQGMTVARALGAIAELRARGVAVPLVLMGYYNPWLAYGLERAAHAAAQAGADAFIVPDLPPEEAGEFEGALAGAAGTNPLPLIRLLAPTTPVERMRRILARAQGFVYLVSVAGVTGARADLPTGLPEFVSRVRAETDLPVCVGFGISTLDQARAVSTIADGVIVGSVLVREIGAAADPARRAEELALGYRQALSRQRQSG